MGDQTCCLTGVPFWGEAVMIVLTKVPHYTRERSLLEFTERIARGQENGYGYLEGPEGDDPGRQPALFASRESWDRIVARWPLRPELIQFWYQERKQIQERLASVIGPDGQLPPELRVPPHRPRWLDLPIVDLHEWLAVLDFCNAARIDPCRGLVFGRQGYEEPDPYPLTEELLQAAHHQWLKQWETLR
jgi:hypothetical protein